MRTMPDNSVDAIVTDPPYGLSFMGKKWDYDVPDQAVWEECLRVLKPGGHLLAFAGTRTQHRMAVRIEDAGFEIRDMIAWVYGSGFPKSHNVAIGIDKMNGAPPRGKALVVAGRGEREDLQGADANPRPQELEEYAPATPEAAQWQGWGTALKPALEPITMARKPLIGTVAANVLEHGTGAINVDGCRIAAPDNDGKVWTRGGDGVNARSGSKSAQSTPQLNGNTEQVQPHDQGRWPANLIHDGSDEVVGLFPQTKSTVPCNPVAIRRTLSAAVHESGKGRIGATMPRTGFDDTGSAARFFYCAKASKRDRDEGCEGMDERPSYMVENGSKTSGLNGERYERNTKQRNHHPTVKPTDLMRYLCRLVTPPGGTILDPFMGSGSTGKGAKLEGFGFIGIEREAEYIAIARARIEAAQDEPEKNQLDPFFDHQAQPRLFDAPTATIPEQLQLTP
jgi:DNA modification methylase